jgi:hypothetical protein
MSPVGLFAASIWFVVGILLVLAAFRGRARSKRFDAVARPAVAAVIGIEDDTSTYVDEDGVTRNVTSSVARVMFRTPEGREVITTGAIGRTPPPPTPGASIDIRYDHDNPSTIRIGSAGSSGGGFGVLLVVAAVMFLAGIVFAVSF